MTDAKAYAACRAAIFTGEEGLEPDAKDSVRWPDLDSGSIKVQRTAGIFTVEMRDVVVDYKGERTRNLMTCTVYRTPEGEWKAGASVEDGKRES
jgi:hypothetical protein